MDNGRGNRAWPGFDLLTFDSGINPLVATYEGAPYMLRGTDPLPYAQDARDWWAGQSKSEAAPASIVPSLPSFPGLDTLKAFGVGAAGVLLALIVVAFGLVVFLKGD